MSALALLVLIAVVGAAYAAAVSRTTDERLDELSDGDA